MSINDCSGEIICSLITEIENKLYPKIKLGEMYMIKGSIKYYKYYKRKYILFIILFYIKREINISHIELCKDVNIEIQHILEVIKYTKTYYDIPFSINEEHTDTSQNYMKIIEEIKYIIIDYCFVNKTNKITPNNNEILDV